MIDEVFGGVDAGLGDGEGEAVAEGCFDAAAEGGGLVVVGLDGGVEASEPDQAGSADDDGGVEAAGV